MVKKTFLFLTVIFLSICPSRAEDRKIHFIYCSDVHYGLEREFRGDTVSADSVSRAMLEAFRILEHTALPPDGGIDEGKMFGTPDFVICTGDIANRMEDGVQSANASWQQFLSDWEGVSPLFLVPGNHDISNAIGYTKPLEPERDPSSAVGIYNIMMSPDTLLAPEDFDYSCNRTHFAFVTDSIRFVFMGMWPDATMREWYEDSLGDDGLPTLLFTHDPPEAEAKHFTNPRKPNDINPEDGFQNLLSDTCSVRDTDARPKGNWRVLEDFIADHPEIRAYFHGDCNYNEFYTWKGVDGRISLPVFRVDSPMKGEYSSEDETLLSFIVVTIDTGTRLLTARECLWNTGMRPGIKWGESATVRLGR